MRICSLVLAVVLITSFAGTAQAGSEAGTPLLRNHWSFWIGGFFPDISSEIQIDSDLGSPGDGLNFENVLGLEDTKSVLIGGGRWRISNRNQLEFEYVKLDRSGSVSVISDELEIGDSIIRVGGRIDSQFDVAIGRLTYGFSAIRREKQELVVKAGLHLADVSVALGLSGNVEVDGVLQDPLEVFVENADVTAPLPHLGLSYSYSFTPKLGLRTNLMGFYLEINDIEGSVLDLSADLVYFPWEHVGFGAGLRFFRVDIEDKRASSRVRAEFEFDYWGPAVYILGTF
jgi:hypothetical protein